MLREPWLSKLDPAPWMNHAVSLGPGATDPGAVSSLPRDSGLVATAEGCSAQAQSWLTPGRGVWHE